MAAQYGQLSEYHPDTEEIASYLERVEVFIAANEVAEEKTGSGFSQRCGRTNVCPDSRPGFSSQAVSEDISRVMRCAACTF